MYDLRYATFVLNFLRKSFVHGTFVLRPLLCRLDRDVRLVVVTLAEGYDTIAKCEQCVVRTHTHVFTRVVNRTTLTYDNVTCLCELTTKDLHAKTFAF